MTRVGPVLSGLIGLLGSALVFTQPAQAVPVYFDFTDTSGVGFAAFVGIEQSKVQPSGSFALADIEDSGATLPGVFTWTHPMLTSGSGTFNNATPINFASIGLTWVGPNDQFAQVGLDEWEARVDGVALTGPGSWQQRQSAVPEPSTILLLGTGLAGFVAWRRVAGTCTRRLQ